MGEGRDIEEEKRVRGWELAEGAKRFRQEEAAWGAVRNRVTPAGEMPCASEVLRGPLTFVVAI